MTHEVVSSPRAGIRAFFAVELNEASRDSACVVADALRRQPGGDAVRWVPRENFHVTLRFLGEIAPESVSGLAGAVAEEVGSHLPFDVELGGVQVFPNRRRPRVIALDIKPHAPLQALAESVERGVVSHGFERELRAFHSHLTLGRIRRRSPRLRDLPEPSATPSTVSEVVLFRSALDRRGATYHALKRLAMKDVRHPSHHILEDGDHDKERDR